MITLSMSLDGFITGPNADEEKPLGTADNVIRPGDERWMIDEVFAAGRGRRRPPAIRTCTSWVAPAPWTRRCGSAWWSSTHRAGAARRRTRLFADVGRAQIRLERTRLIDGPTITHLRFRVLR